MENGNIPGKGAATASMVLGIIGVVCWFFGVSSIVSVVVGIIGLILASNSKKAGFVSEVFRRLLAAVERLTGIASGYKQGANRDVARFADEVEELCRRWEK